MQASLKDFLLTGTLGFVQVGMSRSQIFDILGNPDDTAIASNQKTQNILLQPIWKYGDIELHFKEKGGELFLIYLDNFTIPSGGSKIQLSPWIIQQSLRLQEFTKQADTEHILYHTVKEQYDDNSIVRLELQSGVQLLFGLETQQYEFYQGLQAISLMTIGAKKSSAI